MARLEKRNRNRLRVRAHIFAKTV